MAADNKPRDDRKRILPLSKANIKKKYSRAVVVDVIVGQTAD